MPKEKRINTGSKHRHAPLGQVIQDDENRDKYATQSTRIKQKHVKSFYANKNNSHGQEDVEEEDPHLLDEKTSSKILELGREQMLEVEMEERAQLEQQQRQRRDREKGVSWKDGRNRGGRDEEDEDGSDDGLGLAEGEEDE